MNNKTALVITSISGPNDVLRSFAEGCKKHGVPFYLVGDTKSPETFELDGCHFYSAAAQSKLPFQLAGLLPYKHYARKNLGYLLAAQNGAEIIVESDDDNFPVEQFWQERNPNPLAYAMENEGWVNVYGYFTDEHIWPRGYPLEKLERGIPALDGRHEARVDCPILQGLADENPDVDAVYRMTRKLPIRFEKMASIAIGKKSWCPYNSQNTTHFKEAFLLLYLPSFCSFRMTDIWRSFVAQRICWENNWFIHFHHATVWQERNFHNLLRDFEDEIPGYLNNEKIIDALDQLELRPGKEHIGSNLLACYAQLVELGLVGKDEIPLVKAWIADMSALLK